MNPGRPGRPGTEPLTRDELLALPATVDVATAARALGISQEHARALIAGKRRGHSFPARVLRLGNVQRVCTDDLVRVILGDATPGPGAPPTDVPGTPGAQ